MGSIEGGLKGLGSCKYAFSLHVYSGEWMIPSNGIRNILL